MPLLCLPHRLWPCRSGQAPCRPSAKFHWLSATQGASHSRPAHTGRHLGIQARAFLQLHRLLSLPKTLRSATRAAHRATGKAAASSEACPPRRTGTGRRGGGAGGQGAGPSAVPPGAGAPCPPPPRSTDLHTRSLAAGRAGPGHPHGDNTHGSSGAAVSLSLALCRPELRSLPFPLWRNIRSTITSTQQLFPHCLGSLSSVTQRRARKQGAARPVVLHLWACRPLLQSHSPRWHPLQGQAGPPSDAGAAGPCRGGGPSSRTLEVGQPAPTGPAADGAASPEDSHQPDPSAPPAPPPCPAPSRPHQAALPSSRAAPAESCLCAQPQVPHV